MLRETHISLREDIYTTMISTRNGGRLGLRFRRETRIISKHHTKSRRAYVRRLRSRLHIW
jgi:hypothetical protein